VRIVKNGAAGFHTAAGPQWKYSCSFIPEEKLPEIHQGET